MSEDKLQFLEGSPSSADPRDAANSEGRPVEQAGEGPQRGPDGRFLTAVPVTDSPQAYVADPRESGSSEDRSRLREDGHVPISALLDEREKRQAEKAQREALERRVAEMTA